MNGSTVIEVAQIVWGPVNCKGEISQGLKESACPQNCTPGPAPHAYEECSHLEYS